MHKIIAPITLALLGADQAHATSPWPATAPPRAPGELACAGRAETVADAQRRVARLQHALLAEEGELVEGSWTGELTSEDSDEDALSEQLDAARERLAWANSSDFTCAVGCRHTGNDTCAACPAAYDACSAFGGCDPHGPALNVTEADVTCTCLEGFSARRCSHKELRGGAMAGLVLFGLACLLVAGLGWKGRANRYPKSTGVAKTFEIDGPLKKVSK